MTIMKQARSGITSLLFAAAIIPSVAMAQTAPARELAGIGRGDTVQSRGSIKVCCPPITDQSFNPYFAIHQLPGKNITQTYGLSFNPSAALDTQMKAYAPFAGLFAPAGWTPNSVLLDSEMKELVLPNTSTPTAADFSTSGNVPVYHGKIRGWFANGTTIWDGPHGTHPWRQHYNDGKDVSPSFMQPNKWYMIKLNLKLASAIAAQPGSWREDDITCMTKYVAVMVRSVSLRTGPGGGVPSGAAQIVEVK